MVPCCHAIMADCRFWEETYLNALAVSNSPCFHAALKSVRSSKGGRSSSERSNLVLYGMVQGSFISIMVQQDLSPEIEVYCMDGIKQHVGPV